MSKNLPRKALIAISSFHGAIYPGGARTGLFYTEALHPGLDDISKTGRLTTGTNPASARSSAERAVKVFDSLGS